VEDAMVGGYEEEEGKIEKLRESIKGKKSRRERRRLVSQRVRD
jgi:hypothetical protein